MLICFSCTETSTALEDYEGRGEDGWRLTNHELMIGGALRLSRKVVVPFWIEDQKRQSGCREFGCGVG